MKTSYTPPNEVVSPRARWGLIDVLDDRGEGDIALALGRWDGDPVLATRWNGSEDGPVGTPQSRGLPTWFILPPDYAERIIGTLPAAKQTLVRNFIPKLTA